MKLPSQSALQSWNVSVSACHYSLMWYLEVRLKIHSISTADSILNSCLEDLCKGQISRCWMAPAEFSVCSEQVLVEASQLLACSTQTKALMCVYLIATSYCCIFQQHCSRSLRSCEASSVCCWEKGRLGKLLLYLNLKAVLFLIWWGRNWHSPLPSFGVITFSGLLKALFRCWFYYCSYVI